MGFAPPAFTIDEKYPATLTSSTSRLRVPDFVTREKKVGIFKFAALTSMFDAFSKEFVLALQTRAIKDPIRGSV